MYIVVASVFVDSCRCPFVLQNYDFYSKTTIPADIIFGVAIVVGNLTSTENCWLGVASYSRLTAPFELSTFPSMQFACICSFVESDFQ